MDYDIWLQQQADEYMADYYCEECGALFEDCDCNESEEEDDE